MKIRFLIVALLLSACLPTSTQPTSTLPVDTPSAPTETATTAPIDTTVPATPSGDGPTIANCPLFPANNIWNAPVNSLPTHPQSEAWIDSIGRDEGFHMDFGSGEWDGGPIGIPYNVISGSAVNEVHSWIFIIPMNRTRGRILFLITRPSNLVVTSIFWLWIQMFALYMKSTMQVSIMETGAAAPAPSGI